MITFTAPAGIEPMFAAGDIVEVLNLTTGMTVRYQVLRDLGYEEYLVRISTGRPLSPGSRYWLRGSRHMTDRMGGPTLAVLQEAGHL